MGHDVLYAGTDKSGLVYRFDSRGKGFVLYHAPQAEVRCLTFVGDGVYAGTSSPRRRNGPGALSGIDRNNALDLATLNVGAPKSHSNSAAEPPPSHTSAGSGSTSFDEHEERSTTRNGSGSPAAGENSVYHIGDDGSVREIFREKTLVLSLSRQHGKVLIGTGMEGQLFEVDEASKERSEIVRLDHGQIQALCQRRDGSIVVGAGDPGKLYVLQDKYVARGSVVSEVLDARLISKWGSLGWTAETPPGTRVTVAARSGNLPDPDDTWSDWSAEQTDPDHATIAAPPARFLQYRVSLTTDNPATTPSLRSLAVRYMTVNQAPEVTGVEVPDLDAALQENPKHVRFKWTATDPNEDELTYSLFVRKDGWKNWVLLEEGLEKREFEWDTTTTPSGMYQLKVVASDRKDNPPEEALSAERISAAFPVAHDAPQVQIKVVAIEREEAILEASASDPLVRLTSASFSLNGKKWVNVFPTDGLFDNKTENFRFRTEALKAGTYVVVLKVKDAAGNIGSGDVVFTVKPLAGAR
jgi:hypothetical protein